MKFSSKLSVATSSCSSASLAHVLDLSHHSHKRYYGILVRRRWGPAGLRGPAMPDRHSPCQPNRPMVPSRGGLKDFYPDRLKGSEFVLQKRKSGQFVGSCTLFL